MKFELKNNEIYEQYEFHVDNHIAKIEYKINVQGQIFLTHTEVPKALEGKGIGSTLVKAVLNDIKEKELKLVPLCPFVAHYIKNHPEWKEILSKGINI